MSSDKILKFVKGSCIGIDIKPNLVISNLLSDEDFKDIEEGYISQELLHNFINTWISDGKPKVSGR